MSSARPHPQGLVAAYGLPLPLEVLYAQNVVGTRDLAALADAPVPTNAVEMPPRVRRAAGESYGPLDPDVEGWLSFRRDPRPWLVIHRTSTIDGEAVAARALLDPRLRPRGAAALRRVVDLLAAVDAAPRYGPGCCSTVVRAWADVEVLALSGVGVGMPARAAPPLAGLLAARLDRLGATVIVEDAPGREWLGALAESGARAADLDTIRSCIAEGVRL